MTSTLQVEATVVVDGLGRGESEVTPTFLAWGRLVLVTDWVEMKSSCFSLSNLSRKGRSGSRKLKSRKAEIGLKKKPNKQQLKDCSLTCFLIRSFIFFCGCMYIFCHFLY